MKEKSNGLFEHILCRINTKVVSLNPAHGGVYFSDLQQVGDFLRILWIPLPIKLTAMI